MLRISLSSVRENILKQDIDFNHYTYTLFYGNSYATLNKIFCWKNYEEIYISNWIVFEVLYKCTSFSRSLPNRTIDHKLKG